MRAASAISLGALPIAMRAISASVSGVACLAAAAAWSSVRAPVLIARSIAGSTRSASPVRVMRSAVRWSLRRELRDPLRTRGAARRAPVILVVGLAHDLRELLIEPRHELTIGPHPAAAAPRDDAPAPDRPSRPQQRTYVRIVPDRHPEKCAEIVPLCGDFHPRRDTRSAAPAKPRHPPVDARNAKPPTTTRGAPHRPSRPDTSVRDRRSTAGR